MNQKKKSNLIKAGVVFGTVFWMNMGWLYYSDCQQESFRKALDLCYEHGMMDVVKESSKQNLWRRHR